METPTNTTQSTPCQYSSTDSPITSPAYSPVDTSESDSDLPCSAQRSRYLINKAADDARADLAAALLRATPQSPTNSTAYVDDTVVDNEATSNIELHRPERALIGFRLINMATAQPCMPWSRPIQHRHYESTLLSYRQTNCAHRLGVVMACVYNKWLTRWAPCKLRFLHAMMRQSQMSIHP